MPAGTLHGCDAVRERISGLLDGELPESLRLELERHLADCRTCRLLFDSGRRTLTILSDSGAFELPARVSESLTAAILDRVR
jgi:anti-sigma factor RsiW